MEMSFKQKTLEDIFIELTKDYAAPEKKSRFKKKKDKQEEEDNVSDLQKGVKILFTSVIACLFIAVTTLIAGIFFVYYNLSYGVSEMYSVYQCLLILVFTVPILTKKVIADERRQRTDQLILTAPVSVGKQLQESFLHLKLFVAVPVL